MPRDFGPGGPQRRTIGEAPLILASGSAARATLLGSAGIVFRAAAPGVDEDALAADALAAGVPPARIAALLAQAKSLAVSARQRDALVIGSDQTLELDGQLLSKAPDLAAAMAQLRSLSGRTHRLRSAVCVAQGGAVLWRHLGEARMTMRTLPEAEIARYAASAGGAILGCVGAYQYEGLGVSLFSAVDGSYSTILGLPLLPLLGFLRTQGISFS